jgi:hypothetical protein
VRTEKEAGSQEREPDERSVRAFLYSAGRFLQVVGMLVLPAGMVGNIIDPVRVDVKTSLMVAGVGIIIFTLGYLLQQAGKPN